MNAGSQTWIAVASEIVGPTTNQRLKASHPDIMKVYADLAIAEALNRLAAVVERAAVK